MLDDSLNASTSVKIGAYLGVGYRMNKIVGFIQIVSEWRLARIYWEDSQEFERNHPLLISLGMSILGLTEEQLDDLFIAASKL